MVVEVIERSVHSIEQMSGLTSTKYERRLLSTCTAFFFTE